MASRQISCITKLSTHEDRHRRIQAVGGKGWKDTEEQAIAKEPKSGFLEELAVAQKISNLLGSHATLSRDENSVILCSFGQIREGRVRVSSALAR